MTTTVERSALINFSDRQMFDLVKDIERYPEFMDGCSGAKILEQGQDWVVARLELNKAKITQSFTTRNTMSEPNEIELELVDGPFKYFRGHWSFKQLKDQACKVQLRLEFEFKNKLIAMAAGKLFETVASHQVESLCRRARQVYR